jgi:CRISPR associated protein Cas1
MLGIMHYDRDDAAAFVFDMMEPERPKVDRAVMAFLKSEALHPADFTLREDGVVRLNPELAKADGADHGDAIADVWWPHVFCVRKVSLTSGAACLKG